MSERHAPEKGDGAFSDELERLLDMEREGHDPAVQVEIGKIHRNRGAESEDERWRNALIWFTRAQEQDFPEGYCRAASCYGMDEDESRQNPALAFALYSAARERGVARACLELGRCFERGYGTEKDEAKAAELYLEAAERGVPDAFRRVAECFLFGKGTARNPEEARKWYEKLVSGDYSAEGVRPSSDDYLFLGIACKLTARSRDAFKKAFGYFQKSASEGNPNGMNEAGECYFYGIGVREDNKEAFRLFSEAAERGCAVAFKNLGHCYAKGFGVKENKRKAFGCFKKSFERGNEQAALELAICYNQGEGVEEDADAAFAYFSRAKKLGMGESWWWLGKCYEYGDGCPQDFRRAFTHYRKSMEMGDPRGFVSVAECYIAGLGTRRNFEKGWRLMQEQAKSGNGVARKWLAENC